MSNVVLELSARDGVTPVISKIVAAQKQLDAAYQKTVLKQNTAFASAGKVQEVFRAKVVNTEAAIRKQIEALRQVQQNVTLGGQTYQKAGQQIQQYQSRLDAAREAGNKKTGALGRLQTSAALAGQALAAVGAALAVKGFINAGVEADRTGKKLKFLGEQFGETDRLQAFATESAERFAIGQTNAEKAVSDLFARLRPMGIEMSDIETVFSGVNVAAKQMSLSTADTEGVMLQLSQALGSGTLQGDEFRSVMERLPKIGQAVADSMGVNVSELKSLSSAGQITTKEIIKALKDIEDQGFPEPDAVMKFDKAMQDLSRAIGQKLKPVLDPILEAFAFLVDNFLALPEPIQAAVIGFTAVAGAFALIAPLLPAIVAGVTAIVAALTGPVGIVAAIGGVIAAFVSMQGSAEDTKKPIDEVNKELDKMPSAVEEAAKAHERKLKALEAAVDLVKEETSQLKKQEAAFENAVKVTDARLNAEIAINDLQLSGLEIAYEMAETADERLDIANQIFEAELEGAKLVYQQTLNSIEAEKQKLQFAKEAAAIEAQMIEAEGQLEAAKAGSAEKAALILEKTRDAVEVANQAVSMYDDQIVAQAEIAKHQKDAAAAQLASAIQVAEQNRIQKLVSDEIGFTEEAANATTEAYSRSLQESLGIRDAIKEVTGEGAKAQQQFIQIESSALSAAIAIQSAARAQRDLNAAQGGSTGGTTTTVVGQAAGGYNLGAFKAFAQGGVVTGPTLGLIGEGGEPEYIIPESKAAGFAANYLAGERGASAIPAFAEGGYVGPVNITTGPVMQQGGTNYVTMEQFEAGIRDMASAVTRSSRSYGSRRFTGVS